ncbi:MAG: OmpA family protein [Lewinella sp.]|nr:OmpA family protein [Lewinella sp.]
MSDTLNEPLYFNIFLPAADTSLQRQAFVFENMTFSDANFAFGSDAFQPGPAFIAYADSLNIFLGLNNDKKITIVGHTDNVDNDRFNLDLGLRRAESAAKYLKDLAIKNPILTQSQGERQPVAPNKTPEGRQRNRRVNFTH